MHQTIKGIISIIVVVILTWLIYSNVSMTDSNNSQLSTLSLKVQADSVLPMEITTDTGIKLVLIPAGTFTMGCTSDLCANSFRKMEPRYVIIPEPFYLGKYPVTQGQWEKVMGDNPSKFKGNPNRPVNNVSWTDTHVFISRINKNENTDKYRLPTEAEWEYATRAGSQAMYFWGDDPLQVNKYAWYGGIGEEYHPVGEKLPNPWNVYDVYGNIYEWVHDWYDSSLLNTPSNVIYPRGPERGIERVLRGGFWDNELPINSRIAFKPDVILPGLEHLYGFRLAASARDVLERTQTPTYTQILGRTKFPPVEFQATDEQIAALLDVKFVNDQMTDILNLIPLIIQKQILTVERGFKGVQGMPEQKKLIDEFMNLYPIKKIISDNTAEAYKKCLASMEVEQFFSSYNKSSEVPLWFIDIQPTIEHEIFKRIVPYMETLAKKLTDEVAVHRNGDPALKIVD